tara:strand:+ start:175 stop:777 length:603 start_codon:yes stop_codon:yes gene_type:complete
MDEIQRLILEQDKLARHKKRIDHHTKEVESSTKKIKEIKRKAKEMILERRQRSKIARKNAPIQGGVKKSSFEQLKSEVSECLPLIKSRKSGPTVVPLLEKIKDLMGELTFEDSDDITDDEDTNMWIMCLAIIKALTEYLKYSNPCSSQLTILLNYFIETFKYYNLDPNEEFTIDKIVQYATCVFIDYKSKTVSMINQLGL